MVPDSDCNVVQKKATHLKDMLQFLNNLMTGLMCSA